MAHETADRSFQSYLSPLLVIERNLAHLADIQWRLISMADHFSGEHEIAQNHLMTAAASVSDAIAYWNNVKWVTLLQLRAALQTHMRHNAGGWPSLDIDDQTSG